MVRSRVSIFSAATISILAHSAAALAADITCYVDSGAATNGDGKTDATPLQSPANVPTNCTIVKFKRGSQYPLDKGVANLGLKSVNSIKTFTNYGDASLPLPQFVKQHVSGSGGMIQVFGAVTIDGLYLSGSKSANAMNNLADGIGVMLGKESTLINSEITLCDIGIMTSGDNVVVQNNYVHDLSISVDAPPGVDPNQVGGAEGIFVNSSHVDVSYNRFINCSTAALWVSNTNGGGVRCDGGATEVTVAYGGEVTDVHIHHNFSYNSCGLFEVSSMPNPDDMDGSKKLPYTKGKFTNSEFHDNVVVDSGWISLLQINNTRLTNVRWENNTIVHHHLNAATPGTDANGNAVTIDMNDFASASIQAIPFNSTSSGQTGGGELEVGDVYWTNNLWYIDPAIKNFSPTDSTHPSTDQFVKNITISGDVVFRADPGFVDVTSTTDPGAYDLLASATGVIDKGVSNSDITTDVTNDFIGRTRPVGASFDLGAFEYPGANAGGRPTTGGAGAIVSTGSAAAVGGTLAKAMGGALNSSGGAMATGGAKITGGAQNVGGGPVGNGGTSAAATGGVPSAGGNAASGTGGGAPVGVGGSAPTNTSAPVTAGSAAVDDSTVSKGAAVDQGGCSCRIAGNSSSRSTAAGLLGLLMLSFGIRRNRRHMRA